MLQASMKSLESTILTARSGTSDEARLRKEEAELILKSGAGLELWLDEAIGTILAQEKGINVTDEDITAEIASQLGVPVGGAGSRVRRSRQAVLQSANASAKRSVWVMACSVAHDQPCPPRG